MESKQPATGTRIAGPCPRCTEGDLWAVPGGPVPEMCEACANETAGTRDDEWGTA